MITNDRQYALTTSALANFQQALNSLNARQDEGDDNARALKRIHRDAIESEIEVLSAQLAEFDALRSGAPATFPVASLEDLPTTVIKARIASGLTELQLAERLGVEADDIERAESSEYREASLGFLVEAARTLGVSVHGEATLAGSDSQAAD
jgi:HTH-type transcriptional regulator / antitoxin HigA